MFWQEVCENSSLKDLPFKIELNTQGQLLMTPVKVNHSLIQGKIIGLLYRHCCQEGDALAEISKHQDIIFSELQLRQRIRK